MNAAVADAGHVRATILESYRRRTERSAEHYAKASQVLAGGTTGNLRYFPPYPLYFSQGAGSEVVDADGNRYLDCFLANGPLLLGHRHPAVMASVQQYAALGSLQVNPPLAVEVARLIQQAVPCAERIRFLNSGTEAVMTAMRLARAFTGKRKVLKFFGHYHGQLDALLIGLGSVPAAIGLGIGNEAASSTVLCPYEDIEALERALNSDPDIAAVILDPAMHAGGLWGSSSKYLKAVRELTARQGVVLIFDEVITGFRLAFGGAQSVHAVTPDLATFGKALGAGGKLAAVAGREEILRSLAPDRPPGRGPVFQSGTYNDGTEALACAVAALKLYKELHEGGAYASLTRRAERLAVGLREAFKRHAVPCHVNQLGPMLQLFFSDAEPSFEAFSGLPAGPLALFYLALINAGILLSLPTSNHVYLSFAHTDADIEKILEAVAVVLDRFDFSAVVRAGIGEVSPNDRSKSCEPYAKS